MQTKESIEVHRTDQAHVPERSPEMAEAYNPIIGWQRIFTLAPDGQATIDNIEASRRVRRDAIVVSPAHEPASSDAYRTHQRPLYTRALNQFYPFL